MSTGKLRVSFGKNGNRSLSNPYEALANLYPGGGKMQGYLTSSGDLYLLRYLMAQRMEIRACSGRRHSLGTLLWTSAS